MKAPSFRLLATAFAIVAITAAFGGFSDASAANRRESRKKGRRLAAQAARPGAQRSEGAPPERVRAKREPGKHQPDTALRYLPDNCRVFATLDVAPILESEVGRTLLPEGSVFWRDLLGNLAPLGLEAEQVERVAFAATSLGSEIAEDCEYLAVLFCAEPLVEAGDDPTAGGERWTTERIGRLTVWVRDGETPWAVCKVEDRVALAGHAGLLQSVLRRDGPAELPKMLDRTRRMLDPSAAFVMTYLPDDVDVDSEDVLPPDIAARIEAVNLELDFDSDLVSRLTIVCRDETSAQQFNDLAAGLLALVHMHGLDGQEPPVRDVIRSLTFRTEGPAFTAKMEVPSELVESVGILVPLPSDEPLATLTSPATAEQSDWHGSADAGYETPGAITSEPSYSPPTPPYGTSAPAGYGTAECTPVTTWQPPMTGRPTLTLSEVIRLVEAKVDDEVIVQHVRKHCLATPLTTDDLILLNEKEVSTKVITTLQKTPVAPTIPPENTTKDEAAPDKSQAQTQGANDLPLPPRDAEPEVGPAANRLPSRRESDFPYSEEELRQILDEWERAWMLENPEHQTPYRTRGGII